MRTVTAHAMSPTERAELASLVATMASYGLAYTARSGADARTGVYGTELALDPPLDVLARFEGLEAPPARRSLAPAMRQVVAHECAVERIRRADAQRAARSAAAGEAGGAGGDGAGPAPARLPPAAKPKPALKPLPKKRPGRRVSAAARSWLAAAPDALSRFCCCAARRRPSPPPFTSSTKGAGLTCCRALCICRTLLTQRVATAATQMPCARLCVLASCCERLGGCPGGHKRCSRSSCVARLPSCAAVARGLSQAMHRANKTPVASQSARCCELILPSQLGYRVLRRGGA
jgi:hypothetical protein